MIGRRISNYAIPRNIQAYKSIVDAHREEWRCACVGSYRGAGEEGADVVDNGVD